MPTRRSWIAVIALAPACIPKDEDADDDVGFAETGTDTGGGEGIDADGDGLTDLEEARLGTDPESADSDGDGWDDGDEVGGNTDPTDDEDHPYTGGWPIDDCRDDIVSTGTDIGDIAPDFELRDQFGETVRLYDFCARAVLVVAGATWEGASREQAPSLEDLFQTYRDQGFVVMMLLGEIDDSDEPSTQDLAEWADAYGLTYPVLSDPDFAVTWANGWVSSAVPAFTLLAPGVEVVFADEYDYDTDDIEASLP